MRFCDFELISKCDCVRISLEMCRCCRCKSTEWANIDCCCVNISLWCINKSYCCTSCMLLKINIIFFQSVAVFDQAPTKVITYLMSIIERKWHKWQGWYLWKSKPRSSPITGSRDRQFKPRKPSLPASDQNRAYVLNSRQCFAKTFLRLDPTVLDQSLKIPSQVYRTSVLDFSLRLKS